MLGHSNEVLSRSGLSNYGKWKEFQAVRYSFVIMIGLVEISIEEHGVELRLVMNTVK